MKGALVLPNGPLIPDLVKAKSFGITRLYWTADDKQLSGDLLDSIRNQGFQVGLMRDPSWNNDTAVGLAKRMHDDLNRLGYANKACTMQADIEKHDPQYVLDWLTAWRELRPTRASEWTMEPFQGGWFTPELVNAINADVNLRVIAQGYYGDMTPVTSFDQLRVDVLSRGVNCARYGAYYGTSVPSNGLWDGIFFDFTNIKTR